MSGTVRRCVVVGDESLTLQCAQIAREHGIGSITVASRRRRILADAEADGFETIDTSSGFANALAGVELDVLLSVANLRMVPAAILDRAGIAINFHDGPLPEYAGLNTPSWAILNGETEHGVTWHLMTAAVDAGAIVAQRRFPIAPDETTLSLNAKCFEAGLATFPAVVAMLAGEPTETTPQPGPHLRTYRRRDRPDRIIDPNAEADDILRLVRALAAGNRSTNRIGVALLAHGGRLFAVEHAELATVVGHDAPGTVVEATPVELVVTTGSQPLRLRLSALDGAASLPAAGTRLEPVDPATAARFAALDADAAGHEDAWADVLATVEPSEPIAVRDAVTDGWHVRQAEWPDGADARSWLAATAVWLARTNLAGHAAFAIDTAELAAACAGLEAFVAPALAHVSIDADATFDDVRRTVDAELAALLRRGRPLADLAGRDPRLAERAMATPIAVAIDASGGRPPRADVIVQIALDTAAQQATVAGRVPAAELDLIAEQLATVLRAATLHGDQQVSTLPLVGAGEAARLDALNRTDVEHDRTLTVDAGFRAQVAATPDAPAVTSGATSLSYRQLDRRVRAIARALVDAGVGRGDRVGIALPRDLHMVAAVLATLRIGAAYVPLDPGYPLDRLQFMVTDSGLRAVAANPAFAARLGADGLAVVDPVAIGDADGAELGVDPPGPGDLAYVIYTSGSTGTPKGVMLQHDNVVNFFVAMDAVLQPSDAGTWLAVTSLSFDISVLELLWTLTRGFHIVLSPDISAAHQEAGRRTAPGAPSMSLFYFAAGAGGDDPYRLLLEGARFADEHGFEAVWTPERHFHAFGGAYPNPSVVGAALAVATERVAIRAGSVVLPLHAEARVAEEWAVVDQLSNGRVGISFAAGWQPNDFVLNPSAYERATEDLPARIERVQRLWRGESVALPGPDGRLVETTTLPRPRQEQLPTWLTSAGSPSTFERAGRLGTNILTHLLGQSYAELEANIERYRQAWTAAGHPGAGRVTLMLHTFVDDDPAVAREVARQPLKAYLGSSASLIKNMASAFPTFANAGGDADADFDALTPDQLSELLDVATSRYLETSGLFGSPQDAAAVITRLGALGVDEIACLVDFGVDAQQVIDSFPALAATKALVDRDDTPAAQHFDSVAELVERHGVSHLQCTPSLAAMLLADRADRAALGRVGHVMLGGEAMPTALAADLRALLPGRFTNMYGPTETTIWSLTHEIDQAPAGTVPIGRPIANTTVYVLDPNGQRLPTGVFGELHIGGEGVARGYHDRPELTAERFVERAGMGLLYATGDTVRITSAGLVEFAGRADNQAKIRGHRVELGEIETVVDGHPDVVQSVVVIRGDATEPLLVAFVTAAKGTTIDAEAIRAHVGATLPAVMVPAAVVQLDALPLTPNGKIDRKALPTSIEVDVQVSPDALPAGELEGLVAEVWEAALRRRVGRDENFFDIGGNSLLAVRLFRSFHDRGHPGVALTDVFRFPTVRTFAAYLADAAAGAGEAAAATPAVDGTQRGERRRQALARRGGAGG